MRCSNCGAENPEGLKFCNECAASFKRQCAKCGFENAPTAKFCGECAAPLSATDGRLDSSEAQPQAVRLTAASAPPPILPPHHQPTPPLLPPTHTLTTP